MATFATWIQPGTWSSLAALSEELAMDSAGKVGENYGMYWKGGEGSKEASVGKVGNEQISVLERLEKL